MINIFLFLAGAFLFTFLIGRLLEKIRIPWIFSALLIGAFLAIKNPFSAITTSSEFEFLAQLGMYFLLFMVGFELDLHKLKKQGRFIFKATFVIILLEALFGTFLIYFVFNYSLFISFVVALSFATVGEAVLIPILDEFKLINTKLGQSIIGIGTLDDLIEIFALILVIFLIGTKASTSHFNLSIILISLFVLFALSFVLSKLNPREKNFSFMSIESLFVLVLFILFLFLGVGEYAHAIAIAALLAGISLRTFIPDKRIETIESQIKTMCYGFFAPIFFLWVGISLDFSSILSAPLLILLIVLVSKGAKILGSLLVGKKELGVKKSVLLGIGLSVRFSTSIIIIKILLDNGIIDTKLYSIIVASSIVFKFIVPILFSYLIVRWKITTKNKK